MVLLGEPFPNFTASTTEGIITFHDWLGDSWGLLFSHPYDFTPICTTELTKIMELMPEFKRLGVKVIGLSCDPIESHKVWNKDMKGYDKVAEEGFPYPIIDDRSRELSHDLRMLDPNECDENRLPRPARAVFIIDPKKKLRLSIMYPVTAGRNFDEIIRVIASLQIYDKHSLATPADWKKGEDCVLHPGLSQEKAKQMFGDKMQVTELPSGKPYIRTVPQPDN